MNVKASLFVCLTAPALFAIVHCGGGSSSTPTTVPTPVPTVAPTPEPTFAPLVCDPTPPPLHGLRVGIHSNSGYRKIMDSRPLVENVDGYCKRTGQSGKFCWTRLEGDPQQADCDRMAMGMADTGRYGPTWYFDGKPCTDGGSDPGCYHHPNNQFLVTAKGNGYVTACAADDVPVAADSCGGCEIKENSKHCQ